MSELLRCKKQPITAIFVVNFETKSCFSFPNSYELFSFSVLGYMMDVTVS